MGLQTRAVPVPPSGVACGSHAKEGPLQNPPGTVLHFLSNEGFFCCILLGFFVIFIDLGFFSFCCYFWVLGRRGCLFSFKGKVQFKGEEVVC